MAGLCMALFPLHLHVMLGARRATVVTVRESSEGSMKRVTARALRAAAERAGVSPRTMSRRYQKLSQADRASYNRASLKRWERVAGTGEGGK